ncbi:MAG: NAD(P)/FAD-dependent oxidoreductase [Tidjanibacter sp.]|nr:NAD(P)/FAD-dependent oxidoreductase [Tidjanibacter sp.]
MSKTLNLTLSPKQAASTEVWLGIAVRTLGVRREQVALARVLKRSVDARHATPKVLLTVEIFIDGEQMPEEIHFDYPDVNGRTEVIIVGGGPAGLFAALRLIELGLKPIILERGKEVAERRRDIALIHRGAGVEADSNYAFGEGGAGTFSDGKLFTRSKKRGDYNRALQTLVFHGASPEILFEAHPHIGTDCLPKIIERIRKQIIASGGEIRFGAKVTDVEIRRGKAVGVWIGDTLVEGAAVVLATGHSADDIYEMLHAKGVMLEAKAWAMGVRVEHPQALIDRIQYHSDDMREWLPAAAYTLTAQVGGRGVYSFCMCPGGVIVPAMTDYRECVVNGMSASARSSRWANAGIVTEVRPDDFAHLHEEWGVLAGLKFRQQLEQHAASIVGGGGTAPAQRLGDFVAGRISVDLPRTSYLPKAVVRQGGEWLPDFMESALRGGFRYWGSRMRGFVTNEAQIIGLESRTSTPVRIPRTKDRLTHPMIEGLYPTGEGAGYAGGIISAALDGTRIAEQIASVVR